MTDTNQNQGQSQGEQPRERFSWDKRHGKTWNTASAAAHYAPGVFNVVGGLFEQVSGVFDEAERLKEAEEELRGGGDKTFELVQAILGSGGKLTEKLKGLPDARVKIFNKDVFEIGFPEEVNHAGNVITTGIFVAPNHVLHYNFPGTRLADSEYFDKPRDPESNHAGKGSVGSPPVNAGFLANLKYFGKTAMQIAKESHARASEVERLAVTNTNISAEVDARINKVLAKDRGAKFANLVGESHVERNGQFVLLHTPEMDYSKPIPAFLSLGKNTYVVDTLNSRLLAHYDAVAYRTAMSRPGLGGMGSP